MGGEIVSIAAGNGVKLSAGSFGVGVGVRDGVGVRLGVDVSVKVAVGVALGVIVGVRLGVSDGRAVAVSVGVWVAGGVWLGSSVSVGGEVGVKVAIRLASLAVFPQPASITHKAASVSKAPARLNVDFSGTKAARSVHLPERHTSELTR